MLSMLNSLSMKEGANRTTEQLNLHGKWPVPVLVRLHKLRLLVTSANAAAVNSAIDGAATTVN